MRTIDDYIDAAKSQNPLLKSDCRLSLAVGMGLTTVCFWRTGRSWPSNEAMIRLAEFAGIDPEEALIELNIWRARTPAARALYQSVARRWKKYNARTAKPPEKHHRTST